MLKSTAVITPDIYLFKSWLDKAIADGIKFIKIDRHRGYALSKNGIEYRMVNDGSRIVGKQFNEILYGPKSEDVSEQTIRDVQLRIK